MKFNEQLKQTNTCENGSINVLWWMKIEAEENLISHVITGEEMWFRQYYQ
jgi:hypothetical protein